MEGRKAYEEKVEHELERSDALVQRWRERAGRTNNEVEAEYREQIEAVEDIQEKARAQLQELKAAGDESWLDHQPRMEGILSELRKAVANANFFIVE